MTAGVQQLLRSFDALSEAEKQEAAAEVLRRTQPEESLTRTAEASVPKVKACDAVKGLPFQPRDEWERRLLAIATDCGTSLSNEAVSSEGIYE
jgi:hypothetical protein